MGDFEIDTIIGKGKNGAITTIVDRASSFVKISVPTRKKAEDIEKESLRLLIPYKEIVHTITTDNGLEFATIKQSPRNSIVTIISVIRALPGNEV